MALSIGIVGLPNVGKSSLFNALSRAKANVSNYPFCTIDPNIGVVEVPDDRLDYLTKLFSSKKTIPTCIEFYDIAGLVKGAAQGEGLGNKFLSHIREVDAIAHVVRCFKDPNITHVSGNVDPKRDIEVINLELILADLSQVEKKMSGIKPRMKSQDKTAAKESEILLKLKNGLSAGTPAREINLSDDEKLLVKDLSLLTIKPILYVANIDETGDMQGVSVIEEIAKKEGAKVITISTKLEAEIAELPPDEAQAFIESMGFKESALKKLIHTGYELLNLITFFTAGDKESRAWTITRGTKAPQAAGKIHSDMEKGFIAAEIIHYKDMVECGSFAACRDRGLLHTEGKSYEFQDGDIVIIRFNV
ncbi:redox-regulated ATPase YchF [Candidatus Saganbacteria bacterium]|nr:redox-regulated ATPase YchF [Candidatus Saganbacteria bacterium]